MQKDLEVELLVNIQNNEIPIKTTTLGLVYLTQMFGVLDTYFKFRKVGQDNWLDGLVTYSTLERIDKKLKK